MVMGYPHLVFNRFSRSHFVLWLRASGLLRRPTQPKLKSGNPAVLDMLGTPASATDSDVNWLFSWDYKRPSANILLAHARASDAASMLRPRLANSTARASGISLLPKGTSLVGISA